jgi:molybdenum cofactor cytidylyltransferase
MDDPPHPRMTASAIVLAAGESRRMGTLKPLLPFGRSTVIETVVGALLNCPLYEILVVLGHRAEEIERQLAGSPVRVVLNPGYRSGMLGSVQAGVAAADAAADWFVIALGDQPALGAALTTRLLELAGSGTAGIIVPSIAGRRGHPLLIHRRYRTEIGSLSSEIGLKDLLQRHADDVCHVPVEDDAVLRDIDTPEDYTQELARWRAAETEHA